MQKKVSVIISTKNEEKNIGKLLKSLISQNYPNMEIIVVDNFSNDQTICISRKFTKYVYIHGTERSSQRNYGVKKSKGNYLLFLDADMILPSNIIKQCVQTIEKSDAVGVIIPETVKGNNLFARIKKLEKNLYIKQKYIEAARFINKKIFNQIKGYNENLISGEDWDLSNRVSKIGPITRISTPLIHFENSLIKEIKQKIYYARKINTYALIYPEIFKQQGSFKRAYLYFKNWQLLIKDPLAALGLFCLKSFEFIIYKLIMFNKHISTFKFTAVK